MESNKTQELVSLVVAASVISVAMQRSARVMKLICLIFPSIPSVLFAEESAYIFDFDGGSVEAPAQAGWSSFHPLVTPPIDERAFASGV